MTLESKFKVAITLIIALSGFLAMIYFKGYTETKDIGYEFGKFIALVFGFHFVYDLWIKKHDQDEFNKKLDLLIEKEEFKEKLKVALGNILDKNNTLSKLQESLNKFDITLTEKFDNSLIHIEYLKVKDEEIPTNFTEADIYNRATVEIKKCKQSIYVFTSYLLESDTNEDKVKFAKEEYFSNLFSMCESSSDLPEYRRLIQFPKGKTIENQFNNKSKTYLDHIKKMHDAHSPKILIRNLDKHRPTTYAIIDEEILLWQINQALPNNEMKLHAMFVIHDPGKIIIKHFLNEFRRYWQKQSQ